MKQTNNDVADITANNTGAATSTINGVDKTPAAESKKETADAKKNEINKNAAENNAADKAAGKDKEQQPSPLEKFFCSQLKDIYYAEHQLLQALPKMEQAATTEQLKEAFSDHLHQTQKHVRRLE